MDGKIEELRKWILDLLLENQRFMDLTSIHLSDLAEIVADQALLYRFIKKHKFKLQETQMAIVSHIDWRIAENIGQVSVVTSSPASISYLDQGLFRFSKVDKQGRPVVYVYPKIFVPSSDNMQTAQDLKNTLILCMETLRRWIHSLYDPKGKLIAQALVVVNLEGFGVSNMDYGLIPIIYDIFRIQYPQLLGQVLVLNYGWVHSGIWAVISPLLTPEARAKLVFLDQERLVDFIPVANVPSVFGGEDYSFPISYNVCPIIQSFALPLHQQQRDESVKQIMSLLFSTMGEIHQSPSETSEYYDANSYVSGPRSVKSAADLQLLLPSYAARGFGRAQSSASLATLTFRSRSNLNLQSRSRSYAALTSYNSISTPSLGIPTTPHHLLKQSESPQDPSPEPPRYFIAEFFALMKPLLKTKAAISLAIFALTLIFAFKKFNK